MKIAAHIYSNILSNQWLLQSNRSVWIGLTAKYEKMYKILWSDCIVWGIFRLFFSKLTKKEVNLAETAESRNPISEISSAEQLYTVTIISAPSSPSYNLSNLITWHLIYLSFLFFLLIVSGKDKYRD